jgi:predicted ATP-binding protein involved in virulence
MTYVLNKKARFNYEILDTYEAGIELFGKEIKISKEGRYYQIDEDKYQEMLEDFKTKQFKAYIKIFEERNITIKQTNTNGNNISNLHEEIYLFLHEQREIYPNLYFLLRYTNAYERLTKGYWFWGNERSLTLTFWKRTDKKSGSRLIAIYIEQNGNCVLRFSATDDERKAKVLKTIASILPNMKQLKWSGTEINIWEKRYEGNDYLAHIQYFIENEKPKIDAILSIAGDDLMNEFAPVQEVEFKEYIKLIESYRSKSQVVEPILEKQEEFLVLKKLAITNIGIFSHLELDFSKRLTILIGENGIGKTTILRAIALALAGVNENSLLDAQHPKIQQLLRIKTLEERAKNGNIELFYEHNQKEFRNNILFSNNEYGVNVEDDLNSDFTSVNNDTFPNLVIGFTQMQNSETHFSTNKIPYEELTKIKKPHIKDIIPLIYNQSDKRFDSFSDWLLNLYKDGNQSLVEDSSLEKAPEHLLIDFIFEIISQVIGTKIIFRQVEKGTNNIWVENVENQQVIPLDLMSQGFNSIFGWIGYLMMRMYECAISSENFSIQERSGNEKYFEKFAIVLIDEIDTYLHPKWQRKVLSVLVEKFPNTQFVVTTHSPLVLATLDNKKTNAYLIQKDKAQKIEHFYGARIQDIIYQEYGIEERPAKEVQVKIDQLFEAIYAENKEIYLPLYKELLEMLGENDPAILDAKFLLEERGIYDSNL